MSDKPTYRILKNKDDFKWYKAELNLAKKAEFSHRNFPTEYPCGILECTFFDDPNGDWGYDHEFVYRQEVTCSECGYKSLIWPEVG